VGYHFVLAERDDAASPAFVVRNLLSMILSDRQFRELDRVGDALKVALAADAELLTRLSPEQVAANPLRAFEAGIAAALRKGQALLEGHSLGSKSQLVLCFDGLDKADSSEGESLRELIALAATCLPPEFRLVVATWALPNASDFCASDWVQISLDGEGESKAAVQEDLQLYAERRMGLVSGARSGQEAKEAKSELIDVLPELCARARGSYVYLSMALDCHMQGLIPAGQLVAMPLGLTGSYFQSFFHRRFADSAMKEWEELCPYLALLCVGGGLSRTQLTQIRWGLSPHCPTPTPLLQHTESVLRSAGQLIRIDAACSESGDQEADADVHYTIAHDAVGRWLADGELSGKFALDLPRAHARLAGHLLRKAALGALDHSLQQCLELEKPLVTPPPMAPLFRTLTEVPAEPVPSCDAPLSAEEMCRLAMHLCDAAATAGAVAELWRAHVLPLASAHAALGLATSLATRRGHESAVGLLLAMQADPCACSPGTLSAIEVASRKGYDGILEQLLGVGHAESLSAECLERALGLTEKYGHEQCRARLNQFLERAINVQ